VRIRLGTLVAGIVAVVVSSASGRAQVVVNGGAPNGGAGWNIFDDNQAATSFSTATSIGFDVIRFWGILPQSALYSPNVFWQILSDADGAPGSVLASGNATAAATLRSGLPLPGSFFSWQFDVSAGPQTIAAGSYWLALHDGPVDASGFTGSSLIWETSDAPGAYDIQTFSIDDSWNPGGDQALAFQLVRTVTPEPGTLMLLATGFAGLVGAGVRVRRRADAI
jgi:hypothetical protein